MGKDEAYVPFPAGTELDLELELRGTRLLVEGIVKVVYPGLGTGIEFTKILEDYDSQLQELLVAR